MRSTASRCEARGRITATTPTPIGLCALAGHTAGNRLPVFAGKPAPINGFITFGSFNSPSKLNRAVLQRWARILEATPDAPLLLQYRGMDTEYTQRRLRTVLSDCGVDPDRLTLKGGVPHAELLAGYSGMDIALDPFPYSGGLTTCEALWMEVPVVTAPGETFASRHPASYLAVIGVPELVAPDSDAYVEVAVELASDLEGLEEMRTGLRDLMRSSPVCDGPRFAKDFGEAMRRAWRGWCSHGDGQPFPTHAGGGI